MTTEAQIDAAINATSAPANVKSGLIGVEAKVWGNDGDAMSVTQNGSQLNLHVAQSDGNNVQFLLGPSSGWPSGGQFSQTLEDAAIAQTDAAAGVSASIANDAISISQEVWGAFFPGGNGYPGGGSFDSAYYGANYQTVYGQYLTAEVVVS